MKNDLRKRIVGRFRLEENNQGAEMLRANSSLKLVSETRFEFHKTCLSLEISKTQIQFLQSKSRA